MSGILNFLPPWVFSLLSSVTAVRWIKQGQKETHAEYERIIQEIEREIEEGEEGAPSITRAFLITRKRIEEEGLEGREYFRWKI